MFVREIIGLAIPHAGHFAADEVFDTCHDGLDSSLRHAAFVATNKALSCLGKNLILDFVKVSYNGTHLRFRTEYPAESGAKPVNKMRCWSKRVMINYFG